MEKRRLWVDLITACQYLQGGYWDDGPSPLTMVHGRRTRDNRHKLKQDRGQIRYKEKVFPQEDGQAMGQVAQWGCAIFPSRDISGPNWIKPWATWCAVIAEPAVSRGFGAEPSWGPLQPGLCCHPSSNIVSHPTNTRKEWTWGSFGCCIFFRCLKGHGNICVPLSSKEVSSFACSWQGCEVQ